MATFVLVHGAWHGGWCWKRVRKALTALGHEVFTPTLTGLAERSHLSSPSIDLNTHIDDVANLIRWEGLEDVVLVGHSYGGCVIGGVADRMADRIATLVYLDAIVLEDGQSLYDTLPPEDRQAQVAAIEATGDGWRVSPIPAEVFNVNPADRDWVNAQCTEQSINCFQQKLKLANPAHSARAIHYIYASGWEGALLAAHYAAAKARGWSTREIECGHDIMLDRPEELTAALLEIAASAAH